MLKTPHRIGLVLAATLILICAHLEMPESHGANLPLTPTVSPRVFLPLISRSSAPQIPPNCFQWADQISLQEAVSQYSCVVLQAGLWTTDVQIAMPAGHSLLGYGADISTLQAVAPWIGNGGPNDAEAVVHNNGQPGVAVKYLTIDANNLSTFGIGAHGKDMLVDSVVVKNAKCDGIAVAAAGWTIQNSSIQNNGFGCPTELPGSGIYVIRQEGDDGVYNPAILNNRLLANGGPAIDIDRVRGGVISHNLIRANRAWAAISLNADNWTIADNDIQHPQSADPAHPNHPECSVKHANNLSAGISICYQGEQGWTARVQENVIAGNRISAGHGIRLMGSDEANPAWVPRFNTISSNDLSGSVVGCIDDFEPGQNLDGMNVWTDNNCDGAVNSPPVYLWRLCPNSVSSVTAAGWESGVAEPSAVQARINEFDANRRDGGAYSPGNLLPAGALVATNFDPAGAGVTTWQDYPVRTVVRSGSWGIFQVLNAFSAPVPGACLLVFP